MRGIMPPAPDKEGTNGFWSGTTWRDAHMCHVKRRECVYAVGSLWDPELSAPTTMAKSKWN